MTWIQDNAEHLLAGLGGLYALVRVVVHLTPTPKDDELLERSMPFLRSVAKLFGLDPKQGRQAPGAEQDSA